MISPPVWFDDQGAKPVRDLLCWFVAQLSKKSTSGRAKYLSRKLTEKTLPALFKYSDLEAIAFLQACIDELARPPYEIWCGNSSLKQSDIRWSQGVTLFLNPDAEAKLREWLMLPLISETDMAWQTALDGCSLALQEAGSKKLENPGRLSPQEIIQALEKLLREPPGKLSWRQLGAHYFGGDSKFFENKIRQQWLLKLMPELEGHLSQRPLLLCAHLASNADAILIIENHDSFCLLSQLPDLPLHLVYSQGYAGSASRIRSPESLRLSFSGDFSQKLIFEQAWFDQDDAVGMYFWGDLDYSGMGIIRALRQVFPSLVAWQPGYAPMADALTTGAGHRAEDVGKENQKHPGITGCSYTDKVLLPLLEEKVRFLDQEWLRVGDIRVAFE